MPNKRNSDCKTQPSSLLNISLNPRLSLALFRNFLDFWKILTTCSCSLSIVYLAACGETLNIDFTLPFHEFVPATCNTRFCLRVSVLPHKHLHALVCCVEYVTKHYNLTLKHQRSPKSTLNDTELSYRLRTQTCAYVCLTVTPAGTRCSPLLRITSIASPLQKTVCQQKGKEHLPKTTNLAGGTWLTLSKRAPLLYFCLSSFLLLLACAALWLFCCVNVCVCSFPGLVGWTAGVCRTSCWL